MWSRTATVFATFPHNYTASHHKSYRLCLPALYLYSHANHTLSYSCNGINFYPFFLLSGAYLFFSSWLETSRSYYKCIFGCWAKLVKQTIYVQPRQKTEALLLIVLQLNGPFCLKCTEGACLSLSLCKCLFSSCFLSKMCLKGSLKQNQICFKGPIHLPKPI